MKKKLVYLFLIIIAIISGFFIGNWCSKGPEYLRWLGNSLSFSMNPTTFDLHAFSLTLGLSVSINFLQIILIFVALAVEPKVEKTIK